MVKLDSSGMTHEEVQTVLPWYANKRLDAGTLQRVEAHLAACAICRGDVDGLSAVFTAHEQSLPERPVDEARLDALFGRIDRYEAEGRRTPQRAERKSLFAGALQWIVARPALAGGSFAAVLLAVLVAPALFQSQTPVGHEYSVLSSKGAAATPFVIRIGFNTPVERAEVERMIATSVGDQATPAYRVEQRSPTEYEVVFDSKPSVAVAGQLLTQLAAASNVASAAIDGGATSAARP